MALTWADGTVPTPAGNATRFGGRWRLVGAGLSNVWRYGDLELPATSGRLLLRGPNGTGKTTALEVLWPYLLDLKQALLSAGKARTTNLSTLMREGADGRRRLGYAWLSWAAAGDSAVVSYGVRLQFAEGSTPPVRVAPFTVDGRPLHELALWGPGRAALSTEAFAAAVEAAGGTVFDEEDQYIRDLAARVFGTDPREVEQLAARIRFVRNPALLGEVSAAKAADALRESLPGVADDVIEATGEALAESNTTREAFERDRGAADALEGFARTWVGHATEVVQGAQRRAADAASEVHRSIAERERRAGQHQQATESAEAAERAQRDLISERAETEGRLKAIEASTEYKGGERLADLADQIKARDAAAEADWSNMARLAENAAALAREDQRRLEELSEDVGQVIDDIATFEPAVAGVRFLTWEHHPRKVIFIGERFAEPGPTLVVTDRLDILDDVTELTAALVDTKRDEAAKAKLFVNAHRSVEVADGAAAGVRSEERRLTNAANELDETLKSKTVVARAQATGIEAAITTWLAEGRDDPGWTVDDIAVVGWSDSAAALAAADGLGEATAAWAHRQAAAARTRAEDHRRRADEDRQQAAELHTQAAHIRDNNALLPLPRPEWAGPDDDAAAFGAAITWHDDVDDTTQDMVEATLAASGLLGAVLDTSGVSTSAWTVRSDAPMVKVNLSAVLRPEPDHPLAAFAAAVLERVSLVDHGGDATGDGLVIGRDGTFRAGVLVGSVPAARDSLLRPSASHIGARRRREAALAHAARLDAESAQLEAAASQADAEAGIEEDGARALDERLRSFPSREALRAAESARAAASEAAHRAGLVAAEAERRADELEAAAAEERRRWAAEVSGAGLIADVEQLRSASTLADGAVRILEQAARSLGGKLRRRLENVVAAVVSHDIEDEMECLLGRARASRLDADAVRAQRDELESQLGAGPKEAQRRHRAVQARLDELGPLLDSADSKYRKAAEGAAKLKAHLEEAERRVREASPAAAQAVAGLRALMLVSGVAEAILDSDLEADNERLLDQVRAAVTGKATAGRRAVRERAEAVKAEVAGSWTLDPGPDHPELLTWVLGYGSSAFTPLAAAGHARRRAQQAEASLRAADEAALRDFVVGRLPAAIAEAWTHLHDWTREVNAKMKSASASSGVGVAVKITVRDDLPSTTRAVYELACKTGEALRNPDAKAAAGDAIQQLIDAADGDDMTTRVRNAVDVRAWVDVVYQVTRPGEEPRNWGVRTGLSGGERRLVVLAPMLAAIAALYDRYPSTSARLAALDEVPSEVDAEGREGLARYIAQLDLDLIATSHHWDGAPGAWDGIDAHDLEAAPDGTVVAFPMVVRGTELLPGDPGYDLPSV